MTRILHIDSSARTQGSVTRDLSAAIVAQVSTPATEVTRRDVSTGLPFITEEWVGANFTPADARTDAQRETLSLSDTLVDELIAADTIVIGVPIYNFGVPAVLKAWIDLVARVGRTFNYTENGPVGTLSDKRVLVAVASGGTPVGSEIDHMSGYLRHVLGFIGLTNVEIVAADGLGQAADEKIEAARSEIGKLAA
jgi:FMN-dependent NADH-azoreductase